MADYIEPTQRSFNNAEGVATDVLSQASPNLITKAGSVIRELIIRPIAYLMSWSTDNFLNLLATSSVMFLKTSQATDNPIADMVASNYFVTRLQGTSARGILTLTLSQPVLRIARGSQFTVGGATMITPEQYLITNSEPAGTASDFTYITSVPYEDHWIANVPIISATPGKLELPVGSSVTIDFSTSIIIEAELTSPVTGGSDVETDAELMARAEANTAASGVGSYYGLLKKFSKAPVAVLGMSAVAGEDVPLFRSRYNNVDINPCGFVDCYVKTAKQATTDSFQVTCAKSGSIYQGTLPYLSILYVNSVIVNGRAVTSFNVSFRSSDPTVPADGARLSTKQVTTISFNAGSLTSGQVIATVYCTYIPGISALQQYIDSDIEHFIGQDTIVKAAVPVEISFRCGYSASAMLEDEQITILKQTIADYINSIPVGTKTINFSDIRTVCANAVPSADLRLPCVMTGKASTKSGYIDTFYNNTGIFDISDPANEDFWDFQCCFFSTTIDNIRVEAV